MTKIAPRPDGPVTEHVRSVVTFNRPTYLPTVRQHIDVVYTEPIQFIAFGTEGKYRTVCDSIFLEANASSELLVTTLDQDLLPVVKYSTGLRVEPTGSSFRLQA